MNITDPILARKELPGGKPVYAVGGLHYITGNAAPHFALLYGETRRTRSGWRWDGASADHASIRTHWGDRFDELAALHLAAMDGTPMHAVANGWCWLAGALGNPDAGNGGRTYNGSGTHTPAQCFEHFRALWRLSPGEAARIRDKARGLTDEQGKALLTSEAADLAAVWKWEADEAIRTHGLVIYGDPWEAPAAA